MTKTSHLYSFGWPCAPRFVAPVWLRFTPRSPESYCGSASLLNDESHHRPGGVLLPRSKSGIIKVKLCAFHTLQPWFRISCGLAPSRSKRGLQEAVAALPHLTKTGIDDKHYVTC
jgi:hypothetical protein